MHKQIVEKWQRLRERDALQHDVHHLREDCGAVSESKWEPLELIGSPRRRERGDLLILGVDGDLVEGALAVHAGEDLGPGQPDEVVLNVANRRSVCLA